MLEHIENVKGKIRESATFPKGDILPIGSGIKEKNPMTLILGLENGKEAILAADSKLSKSNDGGGMYTQRFDKLRLVNKGNWIIGAANSAIGYDLIEQMEDRGERFDPDIHVGAHKYAARTNELYLAFGYRGMPSFLLAGASDHDAAIYGWNLAPKDEDGGFVGTRFGGAVKCMRQEAIGAKHHGALYFSYAFHSPDLATAQRIVLAHLCVSEAAKQDPRCGPPVQVGIIRPGKKARIFTAEELVEVQSRSGEIAAEIEKLILASSPKIANLDVD
jgi:20S proteasome alpha/beta subunit